MNRYLIWRAVAYAINTRKFQEEVFVFVDAPDRETAKERIYERLAEEWGISKASQWDDKPAHIEFHNLCDEKELRDMALGGKYRQVCRCLNVAGGRKGNL